MAVDDERGVALVAVLAMVLALLPLAAAVSLQTQLDGLMQRNFRGSAAAFYAAEAGLAHALSEIGPSTDLAHSLLGPDTMLDERAFPFVSEPPAAFGRRPAGYEVFVGQGPADTIRVHSRGHGHHEAVREVEVLVSPANAPFTPAALYIDAADVAIDLGVHGFEVSGAPVQQQAPPIAGLAVSSPDAALHLKETLTPAAQVSGSGGSPSVAVYAGLDLDSYADDLRKRLDAVILPAAPSAAQTLGTEAQPQLTVIDGDWTIGAPAEGFGILVVRGDLEITAGLRYRGLLLCTGKLTLAESSEMQIDGTVWLQSAGGAQPELLGSGYIHYNPAALDHVDSTIVRALLHVPVVVGWREVS